VSSSDLGALWLCGECGRIGKRVPANAACATCQAERERRKAERKAYVRRWRDQNRLRARAHQKKYDDRHRLEISLYHYRRYLLHGERMRAGRKQRYKASRSSLQARAAQRGGIGPGANAMNCRTDVPCGTCCITCNKVLAFSSPLWLNRV
jgi:hypothetical protein